MEIDKNKPKTRIIRFDKETHKPKFIGIETPLENGDAIITPLYGTLEAFGIIPISVKDCNTCKLYLNHKCNPDKDEDIDNCPFDKEAENQ